MQRRAPRRLTWIAVVAIPPYLLSVYLYAIWSEVRLLLAIVPILLPLGLTALDPPGGPDRPESLQLACGEDDNELAHRSAQAPAEVA